MRDTALRRHLQPMLLVISLAAPLATLADPGLEAATHRVLYSFDPSSPEQVARAHDLFQVTDRLSGIEWYAVSDRPSLPLETQTLERLLSDPTLSPRANAWLRAVEEEDGRDQILIEDLRSDQSFHGPGAQARTLFAAAGLGDGARTDVGITTWGKVKDLFR